MQKVPNYDHPVISGIKNAYGNAAMEDFLRANLDQSDLAPSDNFSVRTVWNPRLKRKATLAEVVDFAKTCSDVLIEQREGSLEVRLPTEYRSQRNRHV